MDLYQALLNRRTVYKYREKEVEGAIVDRALEAARWAPNHKLSEPWRFYVVGPQTLLRFAPVAEAMALKKAKLKEQAATPAFIKKQVEKVTKLPGLVVVTNRRSPHDAFREKEDYAASCCAIHNLILSLFADGLGAQWGTGGLTRAPQSYALLDIDAVQEEIIGFIKFGFAQSVPETKRMPLADVVTRLP